MCSPSTTCQLRTGLGPGTPPYQEIKGVPTVCAGLNLLVWEYLSQFQTQCVLFFLLKNVCRMAPGQLSQLDLSLSAE